MSDITKEIPFDFIMETDGSGLWTAKAKDVKATRIELDYDNDPGPEFDHLWGELRVYFDTDTWDTNLDGLIYTDEQFLDDLKGCLEVMKLNDSDIEYSEAGMQGIDYVSLDVGEEFITSWTFNEWAASELPGN
jgi:hypothetical protein